MIKFLGIIKVLIILPSIIIRQFIHFLYGYLYYFILATVIVDREAFKPTANNLEFDYYPPNPNVKYS